MSITLLEAKALIQTAGSNSVGPRGQIDRLHSLALHGTHCGVAQQSSYALTCLLACVLGSEHDAQVTDPWDVGLTRGTVWSDPTEWERRLTPAGCVICVSGRPNHVIAELSSCWVTAQPEAPLRFYVCVVAREHVVEPYEMAPDDQAVFWREAMEVARSVASVALPVKMNYEIHGNTLPHLHLHLYPRSADDPFVGGPIDPSGSSIRRTTEEISVLRRAVDRP